MNDANKLIIAGREQDSEKRFQVFDKYTGETIAEVHAAKSTHVEQAITAADKAKLVMANLPAHRRSSIIRAAAGIIESRKDKLAITIAREAGKPLRYATAEVERCVENLEYISEEAKRIHGETLPVDAGKSGEGRTGYYERFPIGIVTAISPFNFPLNLAAHKLGPAVAAGCPVILKPASAAPLSGIELVRAFVEAGVPDGGISVLPGSGSEVGDLLVSDGRIGKISFTGSKMVGEHIVRAAGLKKVTMELGSNSGVVIDKDTGDIGRIAQRCVLGAFYNQGQVCISIQRIYVHADRYDDFVASFSAQATTLNIGNPTDPATEIGPMIARTELERVRSWVDEAIGQGARLLFGNKSEGPVYYPTALTDVTPEMRIVNDEVFGPVAVIVKVDSFKQGVELCDQSQYGLQAGVFTNDINRALWAVKRINAGGVMVNDYPSYRVDHMPYGGNKASGLGREGAKFAIEEMTALRMVIFNQVL